MAVSRSSLQIHVWGKVHSIIAKQMQNIKRGLQMGFLWEMELHEYKSHIDKGLEFFISVKLLILVNNVFHCPGTLVQNAVLAKASRVTVFLTSFLIYQGLSKMKRPCRWLMKWDKYFPFVPSMAVTLYCLEPLAHLFSYGKVKPQDRVRTKVCLAYNLDFCWSNFWPTVLKFCPIFGPLSSYQNN